MKNRCPCHSGLAYADCCQPLHEGQTAPDAERLMRSRYSAYALRLPAYILHTWHGPTRPESLTLEELQGIKWLKLQVLAHEVVDADHAEVLFVATYQGNQQKKAELREHSCFKRIAGDWRYCGQRDDTL